MQENNGYSLSDIRAVTGGANNDCFGFGGNGAWWIIILLLFGWGRNGFGGFGGNGFGGNGGGGCGSPCATQADVRAAVDQQTLISKLDQQTYGIADATYAITNSITGGFHSAEVARCQEQAAIMAQINTMMAADAKCCCETQRLIERGFADTNYNMANQTRDNIDAGNANTRAILDFLTNEKIDSLRAENQALRFSASQDRQSALLTTAMTAQTNALIDRIAPYPVPSFNVCAPYNFGGYGYANHSYNNGGCGCC
jgi:hypothetical protein